MSHALAVCRFDADGLTLYGEYNGTCDVMCSALWPTSEQVEEHWRSPANQRVCNCPGAPKSEPVRIWTSYGRGFHWAAMACRRCGAVTAGRDPYWQPEEPSCWDPEPVYAAGPGREDGTPDWARDALDSPAPPAPDSSSP